MIFKSFRTWYALYNFNRIEVISNFKVFFSSASRTPFTMKLESPQFKAILTEEVKTLQTLFQDYGHELRIAGGAVRDLLLGMQPKDLDFATTATPEEMKEIFTKHEVRMINMQGEKHGTITPRINDKENFEITTLRIDVVTDGRRAEVEYTKDWMLDANRRDLTINSMFLGLDGTVYDYFNGHEDLKNKRVAFVGDAATRIQEDYLRILRYFRFYGRMSKTNDNHDPATLDAIRAHSAGLNRVAGERIWVEVHKTLEGNLGPELLALMIHLGIGEYIGLPKCNMERYEELCQRLKSKQVTLQSVPLLCGLLDSTEDFLVFHQRCKVSALQRDQGLFLIEHRDDETMDKRHKPYQLLVISANKPQITIEYIKQTLLYRGELDILEEFQKWEMPKFPVNGNMIRETVKTTSGRQVGALLQRLKEIWAESDFRLTADELLERAPNFVIQHEPKKQKTKK